MALIKCPKCNHTVLSAASRCPGCGRPLSLEDRDEIRVDRGRKWWPALAGVSVSVLVALAVWRVQANVPPSNVTSPLPVAALPDFATDSFSNSAFDDSAADATAQPDSEPAPPADSERPRLPRNLPPLTAADTLWTSTWVNIRARPGTTGTVVRVLRPGEPVAVANPERQWSVVYVDGEPVGWLSVAMLGQRPPGP